MKDTLFDPSLQVLGKKDAKRLKCLKLLADLTQNFLSVAMQSCCIITEEKLRDKIVNTLKTYSKEIEVTGNLGKLISNIFFLDKIDNEVNTHIENILQFYQNIKTDLSHGEFDRNRACDILIGLAKQFERWDSRYQETHEAPNYTLQLRPQIEQAIRQQNKDVKIKIDELLIKINSLIDKHYMLKNLLKEDKPDDRQPSCFISYAWPLLEKKPHEAWTQTFILQFALDLRQAGVNVKIDLLNSRYGHNSIAYMNNGIKHSDYIILFGTESLYAKHIDDKKFGMAIRNEINLIKQRINEDRTNNRGDHVFVMLLSGTIETSLPQDFKGYTVIESFQDGRSYLSMLEETLKRMYKLKPQDDPNNDFEKFWQGQKNNSSLGALFKGLDESAVETYYAHHQQFTTAEKEKHKNDSKALVDNLIENEQRKTDISVPTINTNQKFIHQIPQPVTYFQKRFFKDEDGTKIDYAEMIRNLLTKYRKVAVVAEPGSGKSQLMLYLAALCIGYYKGQVQWIDAETPESSRNSYIKFAENLGIETSLDFPSLMKQINNKLTNLQNSCLIVFDNAETDPLTDNEDKEPEKLSLRCLEHHHVLLTSTIDSWLDAGYFSHTLQKISPEEAGDFILNLLRQLGNTKETKGSAITLAKEFDNNIFGMTLAASIIKDKFSINWYLQEYRRDKNFKENFIKSVWKPYNKSIYIAWNIIKIFGFNDNVNQSSIDILYICAFLAADNIPLFLFRELVSNEGVLPILQPLYERFLIQSCNNNDFLKVHRLLQEVIRVDLSEIKTADILISCIDLFCKHFQYSWRTKCDKISTARLLFPHVTTFINHFLEHFNYFKTKAGNPEVNKRIDNIVNKLLYNTGCYYLWHEVNCDKAEEMYTHCLTIIETYGLSSFTRAKILHALGNVYDNRNEEKSLHKAVDCFREALVLREGIYKKNKTSENHLNIAKSKNQLGHCLARLEKYSEAEEHLSKAYQIRFARNAEPDYMGHTKHDLGYLYYKWGLKCLEDGNSEDAQTYLNKSLNNLNGSDSSEGAIQIKLQLYGSHIETAESLILYGRVLYLMEDPNAINKFQEALNMQKEFYKNDNHPDIVNTEVYLRKAKEKLETSESMDSKKTRLSHATRAQSSPIINRSAQEKKVDYSKYIVDDYDPNNSETNRRHTL